MTDSPDDKREPNEPIQTQKNRLHDAISPYLRQHANNPVHWQPWDEQAFEQARRENKPIFLSIGYAACHWCHVMERESFENPDIAALLNKHFVSIKVDREEHPDLDALYMNVVVAMTGQGGWPMSVFLTPDLKPFYGGTYFPPERRYGMPRFRDVLEQIMLHWQHNEAALTENAEKAVALLRQQAVPDTTEADEPDATLLDTAAQQLQQGFDTENGGWSDAPKFPSPAAIRLLLRAYCRTQKAYLLSMATTTLDKMRDGGIFDQLGGGFHRYTVDAQWRVPHFEKMLYDNAQLAEAYLEAWQITGNADYRATAESVLTYLLRDMRDPSGGFYASQDADSDGEEGAYYLWSYEEVLQHLGTEAGRWFCNCHGIQPDGNFSSPEESHAGRNIPLRVQEDAALATPRATLLQVRNNRVPPQTDDKVVTSWNALTITAFAKAALALGESRYGDAALKAGSFLRDVMLRDTMLLRAWRQGEANLPGYLDDYACTVNAFIDLYECSADSRWLTLARNLADMMLEKFHNAQHGGFYSTSEEHKHLLARLQPFHDTAEPSGNAQATLALLRLGVLFDAEHYTSLAQETIRTGLHLMRKAPMMALNLLLATEFLLRGADEITVTGDHNHPQMAAFLREVGASFIPNRVLIYGDDGTGHPEVSDTHAAGASELPTVRVCKNRTCLPPVTTPEALAEQLRT